LAQAAADFAKVALATTAELLTTAENTKYSQKKWRFAKASDGIYARPLTICGVLQVKKNGSTNN
jgi:hypothetical protein